MTALSASPTLQGSGGAGREADLLHRANLIGRTTLLRADGMATALFVTCENAAGLPLLPAIHARSVERKGGGVKKRIILTFVVGVLAIGGTALATPGIGVIGAPVHARGTNAEELNIHSAAGIKLKTKSSLDFVTQQITIAAGGTTGWHSHPGPVLVTIKSGGLTVVYADDPTCAGRTYTAGQSFVDRGDETVHTARNLGTTPVEFWATYLVPGAPGSAFRVDEADPACSF
jgi:quercetin dioxygenase-like cupin family protein